MLRFLAVILTLCACAANSQPILCHEEAHCLVGSYCDIESHTCRDCLRCEDLKREPPPTEPDACIRSASECGPCHEGFLLGRRGTDDECVTPDERSSEARFPSEATRPSSAGTSLSVGEVPSSSKANNSSEGNDSASYLWAFICLGLICAGVIVGFIVYMVHSKNVFRSGGMPDIKAMFSASAPPAQSAPPPYNPGDYSYNPVRAESPCPTTDYVNKTFSDDDRFVKPKPPSRPGGARESEANQTAKVFQGPAYSRYRSFSSDDQALSEHEEENFAIHDEDTTPSTWVSTGDNSSAAAPAAPGAGALSAALAAATGSQLLDTTPAKKPRLPVQDTDNNSNIVNNSCSNQRDNYPPSPPPEAHGMAGVNITQVINLQINNQK